jgi:hypothetical protein
MLVLTEEDKINIRKSIYENATAGRVIALLGLAGADSFTEGYANYSQVQNDAANNSALGTGSTVMGTGNQGNGANSISAGESSRTGNPARQFTCVANSTTLTYIGIDVTPEYYVASGFTPNIIIGYVDINGNPATVSRLVTAVSFGSGNTTIVLDSAIDNVTTTGYSVDPYYGSFAFTMGFDCIAKGVGSRAMGYTSRANGYLSIADGIQVTANNRVSKATGIASIANDFNEDANGSMFFTQQGDNQSRRLVFWGQCVNTSITDLKLDGNTPNAVGLEDMTLPDNSIGTCILSVTAMQSDSLLANYGDALTGVYMFGMKKIAGTISIVASTQDVIFEQVDGAASWGYSFDTSGAFPIVQFTGQNGVRVRCVLEISQIIQF